MMESFRDFELKQQCGDRPSVALVSLVVYLRIRDDVQRRSGFNREL